MKSLSIRPFKETDIDFAYEMDVKEGWNDTRNDIKRMFSYDSDGCFIAEMNSVPVGHIFSVVYGRLGWIGFLIVKSHFRRRGVGTLLLKRAMDYLLSRGVKTVRLEAVSEIADLYRRLGFVDEYDSLRFVGVSGKIESSASCCVNPLEGEEMTELAEFDSKYFGANRIKVLKELYRENPQLCFVSHDGAKIVGYIMCRGKESGYVIGPWVSSPEYLKAARELFMRCMERIGRNKEVYVGVPAVNRDAVEILQDFDFRLYSKSVRMYFGEKLKTEDVSGVFAIGGPEKG